MSSDDSERQAERPEVMTEEEKRAMIERLRTSKEKSDNEECLAGFDCGVKWAKTEATSSKVLKDWSENQSAMEGQLIKGVDVANVDKNLSEIVSGYYGPALYKGGRTPEFARGFLAGALAIWKQVSREL